MAALFKSILPSQMVYIPNRRRFISFVNGEYGTADAEEIAVLNVKYQNTLLSDIPERVESVEIESNIPERVENEDIPSKVLIEKLSESDSKPKRGRKPKNADGEN